MGISIPILKQDKDEKTVIAASGTLQPEDKIVLQTQAFTKLISSLELYECIASANLDESTESLSLKVHEHEDGAACVLLL